MRNCEYGSSLCLQSSLSGSPLTIDRPLDAVRKVAAFQFEAARLADLVKAYRHDPGCSSPKVAAAPIPSSLTGYHSLEARTILPSPFIVHRVQMLRRQDPAELCRARPSLDVVRGATSFRFDAKEASGQEHTIPPQEPALVPSPSVSALFYEETEAKEMIVPMPVKRMLRQWLPFVLLNLAIILFKVQSSMHVIPTSVESHALLNHLDFEKIKYALMPFENSGFSDVSEPVLLKMSPLWPALPPVESQAPLNLLGFEKSKYALMPCHNSGFSDVSEPVLLKVPPLWPALDHAIGISCYWIKSLLQ